MEQWLAKDNLNVYPVWIGNLPRDTTVSGLQRYLEGKLGRVLVSVHISSKRTTNEKIYAFLNLPTAEKQILAVTLLDSQFFQNEKLIVRSKRPSKFPQSFFGSSPISNNFKHFRDCVVPAILANPNMNLNVHAVKKILEEHHVSLDHLPNRVWCVQCTLDPHCHRTYCSFYHGHQEKELGRIISILAAQNCADFDEFDFQNPMLHPSMMGRGILPPMNSKVRISVSRHTLLIEGLPRSVTTQKLTEMFNVFGEIDHVIVNPNNTCYLRMKRSQDARKIVHLLKMNNSGISIQFAPYAADPALMNALRATSSSSNNNEKWRENIDGGAQVSHQVYRSRLNLGNQLSDWSHESMDSNISDASAVSLPPLSSQLLSSSGDSLSSFTEAPVWHNAPPLDDNLDLFYQSNIPSMHMPPPQHVHPSPTALSSYYGRDDRYRYYHDVHPIRRPHAHAHPRVHPRVHPHPHVHLQSMGTNLQIEDLLNRVPTL
jgi:RNA recognition motif-containing protein